MGGLVLRERVKWMRVREAAEILEVTPQRVSQMCRDETIPHYRIGRTVKIDREEFFRWLASRKRGPV
jgi:excisionase family DNA binding protein